MKSPTSEPESSKASTSSPPMQSTLDIAASSGDMKLVSLVLDRGALMITEVSEKMYISMLGPIY